MPTRGVLVALAAAFIAYGVPKTDGGGDDGGDTNQTQHVGRSLRRTALPPSGDSSRQLESEDYERGFVMARVGTNEVFDFNLPHGAVIATNWMLRGAFRDWRFLSPPGWRFPFGDSHLSNLVVLAGGTAMPNLRDTNTCLSVFSAPLGIVPQANWRLLDESNRPSLFWWMTTERNSLLLTWRNVLLNRLAENPVSIQAELLQNGRFVYRYDLSRAGVDEVTNVVVGASLAWSRSVASAHAWLTNALPTNVTSIAFHPITAADATNPDRDGDGLSLADELFVHGTDPDVADTDGDGIPDGEEVALGTSPLSRDTDNDGLPDGSDPDPATPTSLADLDGDGIPDAWREGWFGTNTVVAADDANGDGISNLDSLLMGVNPVAAPPDGFRSDCGAASVCCLAWDIVPCAFSMIAPTGTAALVTRTFRVDRASPWQQLFVSSRANGGRGWTMRDVSVRFGFDGEAPTNLVPATASDSFRIPLGLRCVTNATFVVERTGPRPELDAPLHLVLWTPHVELAADAGGEWLAVPDGEAPLFVARRRQYSGRFELPYTLSTGFLPHLGVDRELALELALPPVAPLAVDGSVPHILFSDVPSLVTLPPAGTNQAARICCWEIAELRGSTVGSGPRATQFDSPYPLASSAERLAFHRTSSVQSSTDVTLTLLPELPGIGFARSAPLLAARLSAVGLSTNAPVNPATVTPPGTATPWFFGVPYHPGSVQVEPVPEDDPGGSPQEDDEGGCGDPSPGSRCGCGEEGDGTSRCSFRLRIALDEGVPGRLSGYIWTDLRSPTAIDPAVFSILSAGDVSSTTNSAGEFDVSCSSAGGRAVRVERIEFGVAISVWNASGRFENRWEVFNPYGDTEVVRCRRLTIAGNAVSDESFQLGGVAWYEDPPVESRVGDVPASDSLYHEDLIRGVASLKRQWRLDGDEPDFVTDIHDLKWLDGITVEDVVSEFARIGAGGTARRRLSLRAGFDASGAFEETRTYWCDPAHPSRHARLRSLRSTREGWRLHDYDTLGRETFRLEQLDGSPFPEPLLGLPNDAALTLASAGAVLPPECRARATVTSYAPRAGDSRHHNDSFLPRAVTVLLLRGGTDPLPASTETFVYSRSQDSAGVQLRTCVHSAGLGDVLRSETSTAYPDDRAVPECLRGRAVTSTDFDGVTTSHDIVRGVYDQATGVFTANPTGTVLRTETRRSRDGVGAKTATVEIEDAERGLVLRAETVVADDGTPVDSVSSFYDDLNRLRLRTYSDGTFETNAYSCCRLLWTRDRMGRRVLRSARTGTDSLYYADEDVWLADISTNGAYRVRQHFFDGLGRETNTVVYAGSTPGEAQDPVEPDASRNPASLGLKTYGIDDDWELGDVLLTESVDSRGRGDEVCEAQREDCVVTRSRCGDASYYYSDGLLTRTVAWRNGATVTEREPDNYYLRLLNGRRTDWTEDGLRLDVDWTETFAYGVVTNSVTFHDAFGRVARVWTPLGVTSNTYDGVSSRLLSSVVASTGGIVRVTECLHDELGDVVGTVRDGVASRTDVSYEVEDGMPWRVTVETTVGPSTNAVSVRRERLGQASGGVRSFSVFTGADGIATTNTVFLDPGTGFETSVTSSSVSPPEIRRSRYGVVVRNETAEEIVDCGYDHCGRLVRKTRRASPSSPALPVLEREYSAVGDLVRELVFTGVCQTVAREFRYDWKGRRIATTNELGAEVRDHHDAADRLDSVEGAAYPVSYQYDALDNRTALFTKRDSWMSDETRWTYDGRTGNCTRKTYADGSHVDYTFAGDGRPLRTTLPDGRWHECVYDACRRPAGMRYSSPEMDYDLLRDVYGNITNAVDSAGNVWTYAFGVNSVPLGETWIAPGGTRSVASSTNSLTRSVDRYQRPTGYALAVDGVKKGGVGYAYDALNRIGGIAATNSSGRTFTVVYTNHAGYCYGYTVATPGGGVIRRVVERDQFRRGLVTNCSTYSGHALVDSYAYAYDAAGRPVSRNGDAFGYDARDQVTFAAIGTNVFTHAYDNIGNHVLAGENAATNLFLNNCLNQTVAKYSAGGIATNAIAWNANGGMEDDGKWIYAYDAEDRLISVTSRSLTNDAIRVRNAYDYRHRRIAKCVDRYDADNGAWNLAERRDFVWDGWNIIHEFVTAVDGSSTNVTEIQYFWGLDLSNSLQGAGGVGGLLAVSRNGSFYYPVYDSNGNVMKYLDESGNVVAEYVYDDFGKIILQSGVLADNFSFRFSTKYFDRETDLSAYQRRFYAPDDRCWINRDPIEENGGMNLYLYCSNGTLFRNDSLGESWFNMPGQPISGYNSPPYTAISPELKTFETTLDNDRQKLENTLASMCPTGSKALITNFNGHEGTCCRSPCLLQAHAVSQKIYEAVRKNATGRNLGGWIGNLFSWVGLGHGCVEWQLNLMNASREALRDYDSTQRCFAPKESSVDYFSVGEWSVFQHNWIEIIGPGHISVSIDPWPSGGESLFRY